VKKKVVVVGLDGATWNLIRPWAEMGELPTIKKLMDEGNYGILESPLPVTIPSWACYSTGKNPGKFGAFNWVKIDIKKGTMSAVSYRDIKSKEIWDFLNEYGIKTGVINIPHAFPPKKIDGFMISGMLAPEKSNFTYPEKLKKELDKKGYKIHLNHLVNDNKDECILEVKKLIKMRFEVAIEKMDEVDFLNLIIYYIDHLQHFLWDDLDLLDVWKYIDIYLKKLWEKMETYNLEYNLILMSDHGFVKSKTKLEFSPVSFLHKENLISYKKSKYQYFLKFGISINKLSKIAKVLKIYHLHKFIPKKILRSIPDLEGNVREEGLDSIISWEKSKYISQSSFIGLIYSKNRKKEDLFNLKRKLLKIKHPETGEKVIKNIKFKEEIFYGPYLNEAPDLILFPNEGYSIRSGAKLNNDSLFNKGVWNATHKKEGIFLLFGKNIKKLKKKENKASIYDLAPTILAIFGVPIPKDMDGKVLSEFLFL